MNAISESLSLGFLLAAATLNNAQTFEQPFGSSKYENTTLYLDASGRLTAKFRIDAVAGNSLNSFRTDWYSTQDIHHEVGFVESDHSNYGNGYWDPEVTQTYTEPGTYFARGEVMTRDHPLQDFRWKETHQWCVTVLPALGTVRTIIEPSAARDAGARWRLTSQGSPVTEWRSSGESVRVLAGRYSIEFSSVPGWRKPGYTEITLKQDTLLNWSATYVQPTGAVRVNIKPPESIAVGAMWRLTTGKDTGWKTSGSLISDLPVGIYTVTYSSVDGWNSPADQQIEVTESTTGDYTATYSPKPPDFAATIEEVGCDPGGTVLPGTEQAVMVRFRNSGSAPQRFWVGISFEGPDAEKWPGSGWLDLPPIQVPGENQPPLAANGVATVTFRYRLPGWLLDGDYTTHAAVWRGFNPEVTEWIVGDRTYRVGGVMEGEALDRAAKIAFSVKAASQLDRYELAGNDPGGLYEYIPVRYRSDNLLELPRNKKQPLRDSAQVEISSSTPNLVLLFHGWRSANAYDSGEFRELKDALLAPGKLPNNWRVVPYDWGEDSETGFVVGRRDATRARLSSSAEADPERTVITLSEDGTTAKSGVFTTVILTIGYVAIEAAEQSVAANSTLAAYRAYMHGLVLGERLCSTVGLKKVHIISHSAGAWGAYSALQYVRQNARNIEVQVTYLDPFIPQRILSRVQKTVAFAGIWEHGVGFSDSVLAKTDGVATSATPGAFSCDCYWTKNDATFWVATLTANVQDLIGKYLERKYLPPVVEIIEDAISPKLAESTVVSWSWSGERATTYMTDLGLYFGHSGPVLYYADSVKDPGSAKFVGRGWQKSLGAKSADIYNKPVCSRQTPSQASITPVQDASQTFTVSIADPDGDLDYVEWYRDGRFTERDEVSGSSASASRLETFETIGTVGITAVAFDSRGNTGEISWAVTVSGNNHPPACSRQTPSQASITLVQDASQTLTVSVTDPDGDLDYVQWYRDGQPTERDEVSGSSASSSRGEQFRGTVGLVNITAKAFDSRGNTCEISWTVIVSDTHPPVCSRQAPSQDSINLVQDAFQTFTVSITDPDGDLDHVEWYRDGQFTERDEVSGSSASSSRGEQFRMTVGLVDITAKVFDRRGNTCEVSWGVTLEISPYHSVDIGVVNIGLGKTMPIGGDGFDVTASGTDIWGTEDGFRFVYCQKSGSFVSKVRVDSLQGEHEWTKGGLMVRGDLTPSSPHVSIFVTPTLGVDSYAVQERPTARGESQPLCQVLGVRYPAWLMLERSGSLFTASRSFDGISWDVLEQVELSLPDNVYLGMATSAHDEVGKGLLATASYRQISVGQDQPLAFISWDVPSVMESATTVNARVKLSAVAQSTVTVSYSARGSATAGSDYQALSGSVTVPAGQKEATIPVTLRNDSSVEATETIELVVTTASGCRPASARAGWLEIVDDDTPSGGLNREWFLGISGTSVKDLTNSTRFPNSPDSRDRVYTLESTVPVETDNFGERLWGYLVPPTTGSYVFYLASDDAAQVYLITDSSTTNKRLILHFRHWGGIL